MSVRGKALLMCAFALALAGVFAAGCGEEYHNDAEKQFLDAARRGEAEAQYRLGASYEFGGGAARDVELAKRWYQKAAAQGHKKAAARLRKLNPPPPPTPEEARNYYSAAKKGDPEALYKCAECFEFGFHAEKDRDWALRLYGQAAKKGSAAAEERVRALTAELTPTEAEVKKYFAAARKGDAEAQYQLARCLEFGFVVKRNIGAAENWYRRSAKQGCSKAQARLKPWRFTFPRRKPVKPNPPKPSGASVKKRAK